MPYVAPTTITHTTVPSHVAGEVYPAADYQTLVTDVNQMVSGYNTIVNDILQFAPMVQGVFTTEAARNTAITSPTEGMHVYLTAPTEPSGTGMTITGVKQVFDGTNWVTTSPITGFVATGELVSAAGYGNLATVGPVVAIRTGVSALVTMSAKLATGGATRVPYAHFQVVPTSGPTIAASDALALFATSSTTDLQIDASRTYLITGLTAGVNTFTMQYRRDVGNGTISNRALTVVGLA